MTRRTFLRLESLEDRMTPAIHITAPVVQAVAIVRQPVVTQPATLVRIPSTMTTGIAAVLGTSGGTGVSGASGGGGVGSGTGSAVGPGPGNG
jgi:hypothetical protein